MQGTIEPVMDALDIEVHVGEAVAERGRRYFEEGRLFDERIMPGELRGFCAGGHVEPYLVRITFGEGRILESRCTCPIGHRCKHVAALLYGWVEEPHRFRTTPSWRERLTALAPEQLVAIVETLIAHDLHLEETFEAALNAMASPPTPAEPDEPIEGGALRHMLFAGERREAAQEMRRAPLWQIPVLADTFVEYDEDELAILLVRERLTGGTQDAPLLSWLVDHFDVHGRHEEALQWARRRFRQDPTAEHYLDVRSFARALGIWASVRPPLLDLLRRRSIDEYVLALVAEGQRNAALALWQEHRAKGLPWQPTTFVSLAEALEEDRPRVARQVYLDLAHLLIDRRTRAAYRKAAFILGQVRRLDVTADDLAAWYDLIEDIAESYHRRWALLDELETAGLRPPQEPIRWP